jgi:hypothetical protein
VFGSKYTFNGGEKEESFLKERKTNVAWKEKFIVAVKRGENGEIFDFRLNFQ